MSGTGQLISAVPNEIVHVRLDSDVRTWCLEPENPGYGAVTDVTSSPDLVGTLLVPEFNEHGDLQEVIIESTSLQMTIWRQVKRAISISLDIRVTL
jgi:hypothetical protein